ncbi:hypothetical protein [Singulisphaera sp. PoT]|uniref:GAP1-N2 domain-containing protein n=1 Tax=Singulisphaera sp. PoT TaxID=3411797 RepID=UPI003BF4E96B
MATEVHYTSAPRGVFPGTQGYSTVACSAQMPRALVERMEGLSAYRNVFPPHDPKAKLNPVAFNHLRVPTAAGPRHVLSRIGDAGLDYSDRTNKYAHHVILDDSELARGGPAWLMGRPGVLNADWDGHIGFLPESRSVPQGDRPARACDRWARATGDAGWAGVLAEAFLADPRRVTILVFDPGTDLLPLFEEALALLPANRRWDVSFSTYFTGLQQGVACSWRGVVRGSPEAAQALGMKNALVLDLGQPLGRAEGGSLVALARTGTAAAPPPLTTFEPAEPDFAPFPDYPPEPSQGWRPPGPTDGTYGMVGGSHAPTGPVPPPLIMEDNEEEEEPKRRRRLLPILGVTSLVLVVVACAAIVFMQQKSEPRRSKVLSTKIPDEQNQPPQQKTEGNHSAKPAQEQAQLSDKGNPTTLISPPETEGIQSNQGLAHDTDPLHKDKLKGKRPPDTSLREEERKPTINSDSGKKDSDAHKKPELAAKRVVRQSVDLLDLNSTTSDLQILKSETNEDFLDYDFNLLGVKQVGFDAIGLEVAVLPKPKIGIAIVAKADEKTKYASFEVEGNRILYIRTDTPITLDILRAINTCILEIKHRNESNKTAPHYKIALRNSIAMEPSKSAISTKTLDTKHDISAGEWKNGPPMNRPILISECVTNGEATEQVDQRTPQARFYKIKNFEHIALKIESKGIYQAGPNLGSANIQISSNISFKTALEQCIQASDEFLAARGDFRTNEPYLLVAESDRAKALSTLTSLRESIDKCTELAKTTELQHGIAFNKTYNTSKNKCIDFTKKTNNIKNSLVNAIRPQEVEQQQSESKNQADIAKSSAVLAAAEKLRSMIEAMDETVKLKRGDNLSELSFQVTLAINVDGEIVEVAKVGRPDTNAKRQGKKSAEDKNR